MNGDSTEIRGSARYLHFYLICDHLRPTKSAVSKDRAETVQQKARIPTPVGYRI